MLGATLTKIGMAGLLEAVEELLVGVPVVTARVAAFPGAQLFSAFSRTALLALATA